MVKSMFTVMMPYMKDYNISKMMESDFILVIM